MGRKHSEDSVLRSLRKNPDVKVNPVSKSVEVNANGTMVGNKTWGKLDFLANYCGYFIKRVFKITRPTKEFVTDGSYSSDRDERVATKPKSKGLNLAMQSKQAMASQRKSK